LEFRFIATSELIHIPDQVHDTQQFAIVRAMGEGKHHYNGTIIKPEWEVGDFVYAGTAQGRRIELGEQKLVLIGTEHIFGKFPEVPQVVLDEFERELTKGKGPEPSMLITDGSGNGSYPPGAP
jgi:co-chaperonin GroES (HSP10)